MIFGKESKNKRVSDVGLDFLGVEPKADLADFDNMLLFGTTDGCKRSYG